MTDTRKPLEAFTLDKLIGRFHELEDENERMRPVVDAALGMLVGDAAWVNDGAPAYAALIDAARKYAAKEIV